MSLFKNKFRVESTRLKDWDYSRFWWHYITICTKNKKCWFGNVQNKMMILNEAGKIVESKLLVTKTLRSTVDLDYYVIMPNHFHGLVFIESVETSRWDVSQKK